MVAWGVSRGRALRAAVGVGVSFVLVAAPAVGVSFVLLAAPAAFAQQVPAPTVDGAISGTLTQGGELTIRVDSVAVGGWQNLHEVRADVLAGGDTLDELVFDIETSFLAIGGQKILIGTGAIATGTYLRVRGPDVVVTMGGANLSFSVKADVLRSIPSGARFRLSVVDDFDRTSSVTRTLGKKAAQGLTWGSVIAAIIVAVLVGGFLGNLFASRRRPPPRLSIYGTIQGRIAEERGNANKGTA